MALFGQWKNEREVEHRATTYVVGLMAEPDRDDVDWLARAAAGGDVDHAAWELRYARRALGLIAAQRDALDDLTASLVARELLAALSRDPRVGNGKLDVAELQFNMRLGAYRETLDSRGGAPVATRMGQALVAFCGGSLRTAEATMCQAGELLTKYLAEANVALRENFGTASLPEDIAPSALIPKS